MTGYTWALGRVVNEVQLVNVTLHQFDENDYQGRIINEPIPQTPALIDGGVVDAGNEVRAALEAEAAQARHASFIQSGLVPIASLYRATLRQYFGELAEDNHAVTMTTVAAFFLQKYATQTLTQADGDARDMLLFGFQQLTAWSGTDNTWAESIPWEIVP